jgi:type II restriction enzyme
MKLGFEEAQSSYVSGSQSARAWTEHWVRREAYCPSCGHSSVSKFENNRPVADFFCTSCNEEYELKSQKSKFGTKVLDGAFRAMCDRLAASNNPNLMLLKYDRKQLEVTDLFVVPKHFFVREIIEERKPLASTARRAGWSAAIFCRIKSQNPEKFSSFEVASLSRRIRSSANGKRLCSSAKKEWRQEAG